MPAGCGLGKALDNRICRLLLTGKVCLAFGNTDAGGGGLAHNADSASELRAIGDSHWAVVEDKNKVIIARFDIGEALPFSESGAF